ncbi:UDP-N-acetylglucosamine--undecaprenyl-phosphate N-acetylglucosaminephosphotransferase [Idiomarina seosinensis]|uniref:UDP-N-acetylglucosamine--undecaprenyl-phosphate N-acetylglucosaminephosphotransferase n=1 Tax=Idiomarina seosinensis TaxID=281739 RepID=UPI00384DED8F
MPAIGVILLTFLGCMLAMVWLGPVAERIGLVDVPTKRKVHAGHVPLIGGIAMFGALLLSCVIFAEYTQLLALYLISCGFIVFIGVLDDRYDLRVSLRVVAQVLIASILVFGADMQLASFGNLVGLGDVNLGPLAPFITIVAVLAAINCFNMVDGIDGLAGTMALVTFLGISYLGLQSGNWSVVVLTFVGATIAYLMFNLRWPFKRVPKVFMGDAGSMLIGLTVVWLLVMNTQGSDPLFRPVTGLWLIALPLMDMTAIMFRRMKKGQSPFEPDREHIHHIFLRVGFTPVQSLGIISLVAVVFAVVGILGEQYQVPEWFMFGLFLTLFFAYCLSLQHIWLLSKWLRRWRGINKT